MHKRQTRLTPGSDLGRRQRREMTRREMKTRVEQVVASRDDEFPCEELFGRRLWTFGRRGDAEVVDHCAEGYCARGKDLRRRRQPSTKETGHRSDDVLRRRLVHDTTNFRGKLAAQMDRLRRRPLSRPVTTHAEGLQKLALLEETVNPPSLE